MEDTLSIAEELISAGEDEKVAKAIARLLRQGFDFAKLEYEKSLEQKSLATKGDLEVTKLELTKEIEFVKKEIEVVRKDVETVKLELTKEIELVRKDVETVKLELTKEIEFVRKEIEVVRKDVETVKLELTGKIETVKLELTGKIETVKLELQKEIKGVEVRLLKWLIGVVISGVVSLVYFFAHKWTDHAYNPVDWQPWKERALQKAKDESKLIIVSIGYSACHWCHVMEHESFSDEEVARFMNKNFVCIKIDREERPDIDHVYMTAVQLITGSGGWPLNVITLPNTKPIYGGTYFPKKTWLTMLEQILNFVKMNPEKAQEQADSLTQHIQIDSTFNFPSENQEFSLDDLASVLEIWLKRIDIREGGYLRAPKFPLPSGFHFLLQFHSFTKASSLGDMALSSVAITLDKMANGGIYDHVGGGFSRYSTDSFWKVPHFEKMLYDNAQLVSLYAHTFQLTRNPLYRTVIEETLAFIERELTDMQGGFYCALDADSEGEEGKFYVWSIDDFHQALGVDAPLFSE
ncbi:hypothetical protein CHS0354_024111 [Potamilus streckersoni]|uniref:Spermatogenesis-associated protein 20-like TRX domain-containing protein n=1 Tax=Potamilus streckersoni TaxID=2493646 RepID=A0AAE0VMR4_9BIVA|nr:hypothetical protein CHS0354_024111 [Potamilus streckersoni]